MKGQWVGNYEGSEAGRITLNLELRNGIYEGEAFLHPDEKTSPSAVAFFNAPNSQESNIKTYINAVDPDSGLQAKWDEIKDKYPGRKFSKVADLNLKFDGAKISIEATTDIGIVVRCILVKESLTFSSVKGQKLSWANFKNEVAKYSGRKFIFRGQEKPWPLKTSFHRTGRCLMNYFINEDVQSLHKHLSSITDHYFELSFPEQNGAFLNLIQHHGFPTPLLDWSFSPYVAAFFAFRNETQPSNDNNHVRIFIFDYELWTSTWPQFQTLVSVYPHLSVLELPGIENPRMVPQQAVTTVTNIESIEEYISELEKKSDKLFLKAIDIPMAERNSVLSDLSFMGISAGSLFPGLDAVCEDFKRRFFNEEVIV